MRGALLLLAQQWERLDAAERALEGKIKKAALADQAARRLIEVPTVGPITASATVAKVTDVRVFRTARNFSAWVGLTGRDRGTGGKRRAKAKSKQGDRMLRTLLINGASSYLRHQKAHGMKNPWVRAMLARRPYKVVMVALAARTGASYRALLTTGERYRAPLPAAASETAGQGALICRKGQSWRDGKSSGTEIQRPEPSSRVTARRNDWDSICDLHQGPRSLAAVRGRIHDRSRCICRTKESPCREGAVHT